MSQPGEQRQRFLKGIFLGSVTKVINRTLMMIEIRTRTIQMEEQKRRLRFSRGDWFLKSREKSSHGSDSRNACFNFSEWRPRRWA